jgi:putative colanic acid biosynthesis acetyltransferase WcaF
MQTDLSKFDNSWYKPGAGPVKRIIWYYINAWIFNSYWLPFSPIKCFLLRFFGARVGKGVNIKPKVNIKYPWKLAIGNNVWIGEKVWIDNLDNVTIGDNVCLSQEAFLLCGNHNYKTETFDLITGPIFLEEGVWIGAKSVVCPRVTCKSHAVLAVYSVATHDLEAYTIYQGNPAVKKKIRI